jgi:hypothetical protein
MFFRTLVIERSLHFATFAICDVVSLFLLRIIWTVILRCQGSVFLAIFEVVWVFAGARSGAVCADDAMVGWLFLDM